MTQQERHEQGLRTRASILHAAALAIARDGYSATSLADIAQVIDKPRTALRHHFPAKRDLAMGVLEHQAEVWDRMIDAVTTEGRTGLDALVHLLVRSAEDCQRQPFAAASVRLLVASPVLGFDVPPATQRWAEALEGFVQEAKDAGEIRGDVDVYEAVQNLLDASLGVLQRFQHQLNRVDLVSKVSRIYAPLLRDMGALSPDVLLQRARAEAPAP